LLKASVLKTHTHHIRLMQEEVHNSRHWVAIETSRGNTIVTECLPDGTVTWQVNAEGYRKRFNNAAVIKSFDARESGRVACSIRQLKHFQLAYEQKQEHDWSCVEYAQNAYMLASNGTTLEPADAKDEVSLPISHLGGKKVDFDLARFESFDDSTMRVEPVEPLDSKYKKFGGRCIAIHHALTQEECDYLIRKMDKDMEPVRYRRDYRSNDRSVFDSPKLAELLWKRIQPIAAELALVSDQDPSKQKLKSEEFSHCPDELRMGYGKEGVWHPVGLNECLRFCKYNPGDFFRKHCDACFIRSEDEQSWFTTMFYLNGNFEGGATRFLDIDGPSSTCHASQLNAAKDDEVLASVAPEPGLCLLFFQPGLLHEGEDLHSGLKYILRTDMMFQRDPSTKRALNANQIEALALAKQAEAAESRGEVDLACNLYRRAFKLDPELERMY